MSKLQVAQIIFWVIGTISGTINICCVRRDVDICSKSISFISFMISIGILLFQ